MELELTQWSLVVGTLAPLVIAFGQQPTWPSWLRAVTTALFCFVAGAGTAYANGELDLANWLGSSLTILVAALTTYQQFWKKTGVAPVIERVTSPREADVADDPPHQNWQYPA